MQLALPLEPAEAPRLREMTPWELLIADYGSTKVTIDTHPLELMRPGPRGGCPRRAGSSPPRGHASARQGRRPRGRAPAPGHREGGHVHAPRGRAWDDQPDHPASRPRQVPPGRPRRVARARRGQARAPRGRRRTWWSTGSAGSSVPTCRSPTSATSSRRAPGRARPEPSSARSPLRHTHSVEEADGTHPCGHLELGRPRLHRGLVSARACRRATGSPGTRSGSRPSR